MFKFMTAAALTTLIAITPAAAQETERRQLNEGAVAAILIGGAALWALSKNNDKDTRHRHGDGIYQHTHGGTTHWHHGDRAHHNRSWDEDRRKQKLRAKTLPKRCIRTAENGQHDFRYVQARCLKRENYTRRLPQSCGVFNRHDGTPRAYGVRCLKQAGYRFKNNSHEARH